MMGAQQDISSAATENDDNEAELVSEFPPPPYYYMHTASLTPPLIPKEAIEKSTKKSVANKRAREAEAKIRLGYFATDGAVLGNFAPQFDDDGKLDGFHDDGNAAVTVFGVESYLEDPDLVPIVDDCCDPQQVKAEVGRLNKEILKGFMTLVGALINSPLEQEPCREELMTNIELILKECNKFRYHQAREIMIRVLEKQLSDRKNALQELNFQIRESTKVLLELKSVSEKESS